MPVVDTNVNLQPLFSRIQDRTDTLRRESEAEEKLNTIQGLAGKALQGDEASFTQLAAINPQVALNLQGVLANQRTESNAQLEQDAREYLAFSESVLSGDTSTISSRIQAFLGANKDRLDQEDIAEIVDLANRSGDDPDGVASEIEDFSRGARSLLTGPVDPLDREKQEADIALTQAQTRKINQASGGGKSEVPRRLLQGLDEQTAANASEAFRLAGGGKEGVKAFNEEVKLSRERLQREDIPNILDNSFPNTSPAERAQLEAVMSSAKTTESGLKQAEKVRSEQKRLSKAQAFQSRAIELLDNILSNPELNDVVGPVEGKYQLLPSGNESNAIADIEEAQNILTADNMDLMTGILSESDIKLLTNLSSGALNRTRTEVRFRQDVQALRDKLSSKLVETVNDKEPSIQEVTSQAQFDALPSGAIYTENGKKFRKP